MKNIREFLSKPAVTAVLFALALLLLGGSAVGGARAALNITSEFYKSHVELLNIGVAIVEKQEDGKMKAVAGDDALMGSGSQFAAAVDRETDKKFNPGKRYPEVLAVRNTAEINEYVRVSVFAYWMDENGEKILSSSELNSDWIHLGFVTGNGWTIDNSSSTEERTVLYYADPLAPGADTTPFLESVMIDNEILRRVKQTQYDRTDADGNVVTVIETTFMYNGKQFCIEVIADSVQDHNYEQAKFSAWGVNK